MTLTVRLQPALESVLERYCAERGVTKSLVVQEMLAEYLVDKMPAVASPDSAGDPAREPEVSANYRAFAAAGFIGAGNLEGGSATKARVREVVSARLAARKARREP